MKLQVVACLAYQAVWASASQDQFHPDLSPARAQETPFFYLQVAFSPNISLTNWWVTTPDYGDFLYLTPNKTQRSTFYQSVPLTNNEHPTGRSTLVRNVSNAVPESVPGGLYTPRNLIVGTSSGLTDPDAGLPIEASVFTKTQEQWDDFGSYEMDFEIEQWAGGVKFNVVQGQAVAGWTKTSACWFNLYGNVLQRFVVLKDYPQECSPLRLRWVWAGF